MSDPLNPRDPEGDLSVFGASEKLILPVEEIEGEEEAQVTAAEPETPEKTPEPSAEEAQPAEEEPSILETALKAVKPSDESEMTKLRQENARLTGMLEGRLGALEDQVRTPEPEPKEEEDYYNSPAVQGVLHRIREENPEQYESTLIRIAEKRMEDRLEKRFGSMEKKLETEKQEKQLQDQAASLQSGIRGVLTKIKSEGGVPAQIIEDFDTRQVNSFLWKKFQTNQYLALAGEDGIRAAINGVERELRERPQPSEQSTVEPSVEASAGGGQASTRGVNLGEKPDKKTPEDEIADEIMGIPRRTAAIDFL